jgi:hypothetical protein
MAERELQLKIALARAGLSQDAAGAAKTIQSALAGIEAQVGVDQEKLKAELKAVEAFTRGAFDEIPVGFSVDADGKLRNELGRFVETTKRQIEVGLQGLDIDLDLDADNIRQAERAIEELAEETVQTAKRAKFLKEAYNLNDKEVDQVIRKMDRLEKETDEAAKAGGNLNGALAGLAGGAAFAALNALQNAIGEVLGLITSIPGRLSSAADANADYGRTLLGLEKQLESSQVGFTSDELVKYASDLGDATLTSEEAVLRAQRSLLSFRSVVGTAFTRAISVSQDLAEVMGGDLESNVVQVGKALEDPITGLTALSRSGTQFTADQKELIKSLVESGDQLGAQEVILAELEAQYGGTAAAAAAGLAGIKDTLGEFVNDATRNLGGALTPAFEGFNTLLLEIVGGLKDVDLGDLTASSERLKDALAGNPETVEQIVDAFADLAQQGVDGLAEIIDAITALTSNQDNIDDFTGSVEDFTTVLGLTADGVRLVLALGESFLTLKRNADQVPIIGGYLSGLLNPIGTVISYVQGLKELGEETLATLGTNLLRIAGILDALPGFDDLAASAKSLGQDLQAVGTEGLEQGLTDGVTQAVEAAGEAFDDAGSKLSEKQIPPPAPPNLEAISNAYSELTSQLELEQERQRTALIEGGATQEELAAQEAQFLQERINTAQKELEKLRNLNADTLDPDQQAQLQAQITAIEQQSLRDRQALAKAKTDATKAAAAEETAVVEESEADKAKAAEEAAEAQAKAAEEARKAQIDAAKDAADQQEALLETALDREEARLDAADRLSEAYDRQSRALDAQLSILDAQASLTNALFDARESGLNKILNDEAASDSERQKAARDLIKLTEERAQAEKRQLEQRQALERQQFDLQSAQAALADQRAIKEEQFALKKLALQRLEIENEAKIAALEGDPAAVELANAKLAALDEQVALQNDIIASAQQDAATNADLRQGERQALIANQQQQDVELANQQATDGRGLASQFDELPAVDRLAESLLKRLEGNQTTEASQATAFLNAAPGLPNIQPLDLPSITPGSPSPLPPSAEFSAPIADEIRKLNANLAAVASNPRAISITSESPFRDLSRTLREISDIETGGTNP